jgi:hypothetical protein
MTERGCDSRTQCRQTRLPIGNHSVTVICSDNLTRLLEALARVANRGPIPAITSGDTAVGITLLDALGINNTSVKKSHLYGITLTARRNAGRTMANRVNLFAQVPDWKLSACKSSREIALHYGYTSTQPNGHRLFCTVRADRPNAQGLLLRVDHRAGLLHEAAIQSAQEKPVAAWRLSLLQKRLGESRPASAWISANAHSRNGKEYFHYRECIYVGPPRIDEFPSLIEAGTITMDHLIEVKGDRTNEKGPLFKINPANFSLLFAEPHHFDLLQAR